MYVSYNYVYIYTTIYIYIHEISSTPQKKWLVYHGFLRPHTELSLVPPSAPCDVDVPPPPGFGSPGGMRRTTRRTRRFKRGTSSANLHWIGFTGKCAGKPHISWETQKLQGFLGEFPSGESGKWILKVNLTLKCHVGFFKL